MWLYFSTDLTIVRASPQTGAVCPEDVILALRPTTRLVSVMLANNETGVIQPVREVVRAVRQWEKERNTEGDRAGAEVQGQQHRVLVHTDAAQVHKYQPLMDIESIDIFGCLGTWKDSS